MNLIEIKREIDELKIQAGIEAKQIESKLEQLSKKFGIKNIEEAKKIMETIDTKIMLLERKREKLIKKATKIIYGAKNER